MNEMFVTLAEAAKLVPSRKSTNCIWRWCRKGLKARNGARVHLEHRRIGGKIYTRPEWLESFLSALTDADREHFGGSRRTVPPIRPDSATRGREIERAERDIDEITS